MANELTRSARINLRLRPHEMDVLRKLAKKERRPITEFVRELLLSAAQHRAARGDKNPA